MSRILAAHELNGKSVQSVTRDIRKKLYGQAVPVARILIQLFYFLIFSIAAAEKCPWGCE